MNRFAFGFEYSSSYKYPLGSFWFRLLSYHSIRRKLNLVRQMFISSEYVWRWLGLASSSSAVCQDRDMVSHLRRLSTSAVTSLWDAPRRPMAQVGSTLLLRELGYPMYLNVRSL